MKVTSSRLRLIIYIRFVKFSKKYLRKAHRVTQKVREHHQSKEPVEIIRKTLISTRLGPKWKRQHDSKISHTFTTITAPPDSSKGSTPG
jgi:hypothetical protein